MLNPFSGCLGFAKKLPDKITGPGDVALAWRSRAWIVDLKPDLIFNLTHSGFEGFQVSFHSFVLTIASESVLTTAFPIGIDIELSVQS